MKYHNFFRLRIKQSHLNLLKKAIWLYNQENDYELKITEKQVHSSCKDVYFVYLHFFSDVYHVGYEATYVAFDLGQYFRDAEILY